MTEQEAIPVAAELTYTSYDPPEGSGGWQTKQVGLGRGIGTWSAADVEKQFVSKVAGNFKDIAELPEFPSAEDLTRRQRQLIYRPDDGGGFLWHTVVAGVDASGRPGNVFVHAVLLAQEEIERTAAILLWGSTDWLVPYGPGEVAKAETSGDLTFHINQDLTAAKITDFLTEEPPAPDRLPLLGCLLDALAARYLGGAGLLLIADSAAEAAGWIAALCHFTSPGIANRTSWSTFTRGDELLDDLVSDLDLVAIPRQDASSLPKDHCGRILIDLSEEPEGDFNEPWRLRSGQTVPITPWSVVALSVMARDPKFIADMLHALQSSDIQSRDPAVPLALKALPIQGLLPGPVRQAIEDRYRRLLVQQRMNDGPREAAEYITTLAKDDGLLEMIPAPPIPDVRADLDAHQMGIVLNCLYRRQSKVTDDRLIGKLDEKPFGSFQQETRVLLGQKGASLNSDPLPPETLVLVRQAINGAVTLIALCHTAGDERLISECGKLADGVARLLSTRRPEGQALIQEVQHRVSAEIQKSYSLIPNPTQLPPPAPTPRDQAGVLEDHFGRLLNLLADPSRPEDLVNQQLAELQLTADQAALISQLARPQWASALNGLLLASDSFRQAGNAIPSGWATLGRFNILLYRQDSPARLLADLVLPILQQLEVLAHQEPWLISNPVAPIIVRDFLEKIVDVCGTDSVFAASTALQQMPPPSTLPQYAATQSYVRGELAEILGEQAGQAKGRL